MLTLVEKLRPTVFSKLNQVADFERWLELKVPAYQADPAKEPSPKRVPLGSRFPSLSSLADAVQAGELGALEAALILVGTAAPSTVEGEAIEALHEGWPHLQTSAARVLGGCESEQSFRALLSALIKVGAAGFELKNNAYADGARLVLERLSTHPTVSPIPAAEDLDAAYTQDQRQEAQALLAFLGTEPKDPKLQKASVELLRKVYAEHPERYLRMAAGHALCERGDAESLQLLISLESATDKWGHFFAVKALFQLEPSTSFKRLEPRLSDEVFAGYVVDQLLLRSQAALKADAERGWLPGDAGWLGWLASIRKNRQLGQSAQAILAAYKGPAPSVPKSTTTKPKPAKAIKAPRSAPNPAVSQAVSAYLKTPSPTAWRELSRALGKKPLDAETTKLALPAVQRFIDQALAHLQLIHKELKTAGYRFLAKQPVQLAKKDAEKQIETLEKEIGPLPLTLRVWLLTVGAVDLRGQLDDWGTCHAEFLAKGDRAEIVRTDALMVCSLADAFDELDNWNEEQPFEFPLGPDADGKAGFSAGDEALLVNGPSFEATLVDAPKRLVFSDYLRQSLKHAGFPGLAKRAAKDPVLQQILRQLAPL